MVRLFAALALLVTCSTARAQDPTVTDGDLYIVRFENDRVRVLEYQDLPGTRTHLHDHPPFVLYAVSPFRRRITLPDGTEMVREFQAGDILFSDAQTHIGENIGESPTHAIIVELK